MHSKYEFLINELRKKYSDKVFKWESDKELNWIYTGTFIDPSNNVERSETQLDEHELYQFFLNCLGKSAVAPNKSKRSMNRIDRPNPDKLWPV